MRYGRGLWVLLFIACMPQFSASAQPSWVDWGEVSQEALAQTAYAGDSNAAAVVLVDHGLVRFEDGRNPVYDRYRRIKILSKAGFDWGTVEIPFLAGDQDIRNIDAQTIVIGADGRIQRHKVRSADIYEESLSDDWSQMRFTMPRLAPGVIIEYRYSLAFDSPLSLPSWSFQLAEPVVWSGYEARIPNVLNYVRVTTGLPTFDVETAEPFVRSWGEGMHSRWVMQDIPALREEPYMTTPNDYRYRMQFQMSAYHNPGFGMKDVLVSWQNVADELIDASSFGGLLEGTQAIRQNVEALTDTVSKPAGKVRALYDFVRTHIPWNNERSVYPDDEPDTVLRDRSGASAEVCMLLVAMLRAADLEAYPVLYSTRSHGHVIKQYPLLSQFNDMLVYVRAGGTTYLFSPTSLQRPHTLLPIAAQGMDGWIVRKDDPGWVELESDRRYEEEVTAAISITPDASLSGSLSVQAYGYSALVKRKQLSDQAPDELIRTALLSDVEGASLESFDIQHAEAIDGPIILEAAFTAADYVQKAANFLYVNPHIMSRLDENPLRLAERRYPLDLEYREDHAYKVTIDIPDGYVVESLPNNRYIRPATGGAMYNRQVIEGADSITLESRFVLARISYPPSSYKEMKEFMGDVVATEQDMLVLKRADVSASTGGK